MTRNRSKKALYEVMSKARIKPEHGKIVEHSRPTTDESAPAIKQKSDVGVPKSAAKWWRKPRIVQVNAGRIEFSMPYQIAVVLLLGFVFVIIAAYRLGQSFNPAEQQQQADQPDPAMQETDSETSVEQAASDIMRPVAPAESTTAKTEVAESAKPAGNNVIVLVEYNSMPDLAPVQAHFSEYGIETEIKLERGSYFLQTKQRYDNPATPGTDGYKAKQKITEVGKEYKAPAGYETFARFLFSDAYGKKVN